MTLERVSRYREYCGKAGAILCLLLILTVLDGVTAQFRHPLNLLEVFPGGRENVNGILGPEISGIDRLTATSNSDLIRLHFEGLQTGFWFGQKMWRGTIEISPRILPGKYDLSVYPQGDPPAKPLSSFTVRVYRDYQDYRRDALSFCVRYVGISAWSFLAFVFPLTCLAFAVVYILSRKEGELLAREGRAEIYRIARGEWGFEIAFGLGARHGVRIGSEFALLDETGGQTAVIVAHKVSDTDTVAQVGVDSEVKPGYSVRKL